MGDDYRVRLYGETAVLHHRATVVENRNSVVTQFQLRMTHVLGKRDGRWQVVGRHQSRIAP